MLGIISKLQSVLLGEAIFFKESVPEAIEKVKLNAMEALELTASSYLESIQESVNNTYIDEPFRLKNNKRQLTCKEATQLIWHSFRFSNGNAALQFTMLYQAWKKYGEQNINIELIWGELQKMLKVGTTHSTTTVKEWEEPHWRPPHPKINRIVTTIEHGTDIGLSDAKSHAVITSEMIADGIEPIKMLLTGKGGITPKDTYHGPSYTSRIEKMEYKGYCIDSIFEADYGYIVGKKGEGERPNRNPENDGNNNLKDRYFSYLIWYVIKNNSTGNDFFDEYFGQLHRFFPKWFAGLPTDSELEELNNKWYEEEGYYNTKNPFRKDKYGYSTKITKEDVLILIAKYNLTHPDTQVVLEEIL